MSSVQGYAIAAVLAAIAVTLLTLAYRGRRARVLVEQQAEADDHAAYWTDVQRSGDLSGHERLVDEVTFANLREAYKTGVYQGLGG